MSVLDEIHRSRGHDPTAIRAHAERDQAHRDQLAANASIVADLEFDWKEFRRPTAQGGLGLDPATACARLRKIHGAAHFELWRSTPPKGW